MAGTTNDQAIPASHADDPRGPRAARTREVRRVLVIILVLNLLVAGAKIAFGLLSGSLAIAADGFASMLDASGNVIGLVGLSVAARPPDPNHPYGHHRYETLTSLAIAALMLLALFTIVQQAWGRLQSGTVPTVTTASFVVMLGTLVVNVVITVWERRVGRRLSSSILLADAQHTTTDVYVTLSVIAALGAVALGYGWADAAITFVIALAIAWGAWQIVRDATFVLSDGAVAEEARIAEAVLATPGVQGTHNVRSRGGEGRAWVDLHIQVDPEMSVHASHAIASVVARRVEEILGRPADVIVHVEPADEQHLREERGHDPDAPDA